MVCNCVSFRKCKICTFDTFGPQYESDHSHSDYLRLLLVRPQLCLYNIFIIDLMYNLCGIKLVYVVWRWLEFIKAILDFFRTMLIIQFQFCWWKKVKNFSGYFKRKIRPFLYTEFDLKCIWLLYIFY